MGHSAFSLQYRDLDQLVADAQAAQGDDTPAMNEIVRRFEPLAQKSARSLTNDLNLREDLANAARLALVTAVRKHNGQAGFPAYAKRYMTGAALRELRFWIDLGGAADATLTSLDAEMEAENESSTVEQALGVEDNLYLAPWGAGDLDDAVQDLREEQRDLLVLRYIEDLELADIAEFSLTTVSAVSQRLATCRHNLSEALAA